MKSHPLHKEQWSTRWRTLPSNWKKADSTVSYLCIHMNAYFMNKAYRRCTHVAVCSLSNKWLNLSFALSVLLFSVVIKVLRRSCWNILTVTDLIIDGWLLGFAEWPHLTVPCNAQSMVDPLSLSSCILPLPPLGSSQIALSATQACSMLMQCDQL